MERIKYTFFDRHRVPDYDNPRHMKTVKLDFNKEKCKECGICLQVCPGGCLITDTVMKMDLISGKVKGGKYGIPKLQASKLGAPYCIACFDCGVVCPQGAISIKSNFNPGWHFKRLTQTSVMKYPKQY